MTLLVLKCKAGGFDRKKFCHTQTQTHMVANSSQLRAMFLQVGCPTVAQPAESEQTMSICMMQPAVCSQLKSSDQNSVQLEASVSALQKEAQGTKASHIMLRSLEYCFLFYSQKIFNLCSLRYRAYCKCRLHHCHPACT